MISLLTNTSSIVAQENLRVDSALQAKLIDEVTSGLRITSSGDDAAGLAVANAYRSDLAVLSQGVRNANDGVSQLQIVDGGLSNIAQLLDRLNTLAAESASGTFTGDRTVLNGEYQQVLSEITRQATDIGLNSGGGLNHSESVYIGGAPALSTASVAINLSGSANAVDAASLGLSGSTSTGSFFTGNNVTNLNDPNALFNIGASGAETFAVTYADASGNVTTAPISITGTAGGVGGTAFVNAVNDALSTGGVTGISSAIGSNGDLEFTGANLLSVTAGSSGTAPASLAVQSGATLLNASNYQSTGTLAPFVAGGSGPTTETLSLTTEGSTYTINLDSSASGNTSAVSAGNLIASLNQQLAGSGVYATNVGNAITLQSPDAFSLAETGYSAGAANNGFLTDVPTGVNWQASVAFTPFTPAQGGSATTETLVLRIRNVNHSFTLSSNPAGNTAANTMANAIDSINTQLALAGVNDVVASDAGSGNILFKTTGVDWFLLTEQSYSGTIGSIFGTAAGSVPVTQSGPTYATAHVHFTAFSGSQTETLTVTAGGTDYHISLNSGNAGTLAQLLTTLSTQLSGSNVFFNQWSDGVGLRSNAPFTVSVTGYSPASQPGSGSLFGTALGSLSTSSPSISGGTAIDTIQHAQNALSVIAAAGSAIGKVQGVVGTSQNKLYYALALAQSQITNFSAAESQIRDADMAAEAAKLTKAQILQQACLAAMVQANSSGRVVLNLLRA